MKNSVSIFALLYCFSGFCQTPQDIMDSIVEKTKEISYYSNETDWDSLEKEIYESIAITESLDDIIPACEILLNGIRDHHGRIKRNSDYSDFANFTDYKNARFSDDREFKSENWHIINDLEARFSYQMLQNNTAYLRVVGIGPQLNGQEESERIRKAVLELNEKGAEKWIIDLRYNSGGNINVMLSGLAPLLDTGTVASIGNSDGEMFGNAEIKDGNFWYFEVNAFPINDTTQLHPSQIAVLTSRWTASSGELAAIAFKSQDNTRFFGEATGGYTTNTSWEPIGSSLSLVIATGVFCDRTGTAYDENFTPDVEIPFIVKTPMNEDACIEAALQWLENN